MTNIRPDQTMEVLQKTAYPDKHTMVLHNACKDNDFWQKIWLIDRFAKALGFVEVKQP